MFLFNNSHHTPNLFQGPYSSFIRSLITYNQKNTTDRKDCTESTKNILLQRNNTTQQR